MQVALIGLMQSGKSSLFSAISGKDITPAGATRIEEAIVAVPDQRLDWLTQLYHPQKTVPGTIDCLDVPGLGFTDDSRRTASRQMISKVRSADMFVLVVRNFNNPVVPLYRERISPVDDINELLEELLLADLELVTTRIEKLELQIKKGAKTLKQDQEELALQLRLQEALEAAKPANTVIESERDFELVKPFGFYTLKPITVVINVSEEDLTKQIELSNTLDSSVPVITLSAALEQELSCLDPESKEEFMAELGINETAASKFVNSCYSAMGLISFLTVGKDEVRAWPIKRGTKARQAAGKVHSDIERGFIRAETMTFSVLQELGDEKAVKAAGKMRLEGKDYLVQDGDVINFRFNV